MHKSFVHSHPSLVSFERNRSGIVDQRCLAPSTFMCCWCGERCCTTAMVPSSLHCHGTSMQTELLTDCFLESHESILKPTVGDPREAPSENVQEMEKDNISSEETGSVMEPLRRSLHLSRSSTMQDPSLQMLKLPSALLPSTWDFAQRNFVKTLLLEHRTADSTILMVLIPERFLLLSFLM